MQTFRRERATSFLFEELTVMLQSDLDDPRLAALTVTEVDLTKDRRVARVYVTCHTGEEDLQEGLRALESAKSLIRGRVGQLLHWRFTPEVEFRADRTPQRGARLDELFRALDEDKTRRQGTPGEGDAPGAA